MGKTKPISEHVKQKSIGLRLDQWEFFSRHPEFNIAEFVRFAIDKRIEVIEGETTN